MKSYLVIPAMLFFGKVTAQTTTSVVTTSLNDTTIKVENAIIIKSNLPSKIIILSPGVADWEAEKFFVKKETTVDDVRILSLFHGAVRKEKVLYQVGNKLNYFIREVPDNFGAVGWFLVVLFFITLVFSMLEESSWYHTFFSPIIIGFGFSFLVDICAVKYDYTWEEWISFAAIGLSTGIVALLLRILVIEIIRREKQLTFR